MNKGKSESENKNIDIKIVLVTIYLMIGSFLAGGFDATNTFRTGEAYGTLRRSVNTTIVTIGWPFLILAYAVTSDD